MEKRAKQQEKQLIRKEIQLTKMKQLEEIIAIKEEKLKSKTPFVRRPLSALKFKNCNLPATNLVDFSTDPDLVLRRVSSFYDRVETVVEETERTKRKLLEERKELTLLQEKYRILSRKAEDLRSRDNYKPDVIRLLKKTEDENKYIPNCFKLIISVETCFVE